MLFFTSNGDLKRKNSGTAAPFWPQRDMRGVGSRVNASGQRSIERNLTQCFFFGRESFIVIGVLSLPRMRNILVTKIEFIMPKN